MKSNKLTIKINKPLETVFAFSRNPKNSPLWIPSFVYEETSEWPVKLGTIYRNKNETGQWNEYTVSAFKENGLFELTSQDGNYHVKYTFRKVGGNVTELKYYEWVDKGELEKPFVMQILEKLKILIEKITPKSSPNRSHR